MAGEFKAVELLQGNTRDGSVTKSAGTENQSFASNYPNSFSVTASFIEKQPCDQPSVIEQKQNKDCYKMTSVSSGYCLIINNVDFNGLADKRLGSDLDAEKLDKLFKHLGYRVFLRKNLTGMKMNNTLYDFSKKKEHEDVDSLVVIILSHGFTGFIYGTDMEKVYINDLLEMFDNVNCARLIGKPKMFFIQACRGEKYDSGVYKYELADSLTVTSKLDSDNQIDGVYKYDSADSLTVTSKLDSNNKLVEVRGQHVPTLTDMLISYSTIEGYISIRDHDSGSWYCHALCDVFEEYSSNRDVESMLKMVDKLVKSNVASTGDRQATEMVYKGWDKSLYFNVG